tara:strand:- start:711 stop:899 length:189 start_codon:yes stop_codon:yes gene_type:complete
MVGGFEGASSSVTIKKVSYFGQWNTRVIRLSEVALDQTALNKANGNIKNPKREAGQKYRTRH